MRSSKLLFCFLFLAGTFVLAQAPTPTAKVPGQGTPNQNEVFGGFMYEGSDWGPAYLLGFDANYTRFFGRRFGAVLDFDYGGFHNGVDGHSFEYRVGPRVNLIKNERIQPFVNFLIGGGHLNANVRTDITSGPIVNRNWSGFAWEAGGGIDFRLTHHLGARFQGNWSHLPYGNNDSSQWQPLAFGVTYKW